MPQFECSTLSSGKFLWCESVGSVLQTAQLRVAAECDQWTSCMISIVAMLETYHRLGNA